MGVRATQHRHLCSTVAEATAAEAATCGHAACDAYHLKCLNSRQMHLYLQSVPHGGSLRTLTAALQKKKRGYTGVFKLLRRNGHLEYQKAANSSAQTVTLEAQPQGKAPVCDV
jgi:hypothetical protein